ncbi:MAG: hypothetical protein A3G75_08715 [Verrucomicrobia bacterium RIFCSPLOWO2_12_FULL_64_8]|nr:MAG: hypothetical protein A3G75_08715 [Verrucomicrobia bacterium RIFCSPLOWO2_12_FULL_64_8]
MEDGDEADHWFRTISFKGKPVELVEKELVALHLPGLRFRRINRTGAKGKPVSAVYVEVTDWNAWHPTELSFHLMRLACKLDPPNPFAKLNIVQMRSFNIHVGSTVWWNALKRDGARVKVEAFLAEWRQRNQVYQQQSRRYWLYPE